MVDNSSIASHTEFLSKLDYQTLVRLLSLDIEDKNVLGMIEQEIEIRQMSELNKGDK
jgi:hypothetical protein